MGPQRVDFNNLFEWFAVTPAPVLAYSITLVSEKRAAACFSPCGATKMRCNV